LWRGIKFETALKNVGAKLKESRSVGVCPSVPFSAASTFSGDKSGDAIAFARKIGALSSRRQRRRKLFAFVREKSAKTDRGRFFIGVFAAKDPLSKRKSGTYRGRELSKNRKYKADRL